MLLYIWTSKPPAVSRTVELCVQGWVSILDYLLLENDRADYFNPRFCRREVEIFEGRLGFLFAFEIYIYWHAYACAHATFGQLTLGHQRPTVRSLFCP